MATLKFIIKAGQVKFDGTTNIKLRIIHHRKTIYLPTSFYVKPSEFDSKVGELNNKHKSYMKMNAELQKFKLGIMDKIFQIPNYEVIPVDTLIKQIHRSNKQESTLFTEFVDKIIPDIKKGSSRNAEIYESTKNKIEDFQSNLYLHQIDKQFLKDFDYSMLKDEKSINTRSFYHRTLRAILNRAIDDESINYDLSHYPYRGFKIKNESTKSRHLDIEELRTLYNYSSKNKYKQRARDIFMLMFYLIGINTVDIYRLDPPNKNRIHYIRSKTKGRFEIELIGEALELYEKYKDKEGKKAFNFHHTFSDHRNLYKSVNDNLDNIAKELEIEAKITTYYARHTWAHIALNECRIDKDVIAAALGHSRTKITDIYARAEQRLIDEANREVQIILH